jgi:Domain of unknown function (DUF4129)
VGGRATRALAPAFLVLALVGLVAIASTGSRPSSTGDTRRPADMLLDIFFTFALLAFIPATAMLVWALMQRKEIAAGYTAGRSQRSALVSFLALMAVLGILAYWRRRDPELGVGEQFQDVIVPRGSGAPAAGADETESYRAEFAWIPVLVLLALIGLGLAAAYVSRRQRRQRWQERNAFAEAVLEVLEDTLDDLRAEADARKAVIAAYARLERTLAAHDAPRNAAETPEEYFTRILPQLSVGEGSIRRLTDLFTRAKFSQHEVDAAMKEEAIDALVQVRDELRSAAEEPTSAPPPSSTLRTREEGA